MSDIVKHHIRWPQGSLQPVLRTAGFFPSYLSNYAVHTAAEKYIELIQPLVASPLWLTETR